MNIQNDHGKATPYQVRRSPLKAIARLLRQNLEKMLPNDFYTYRVTWSVEDNEYIAKCLEFPSLSWLAADQETALAGIRQVVADVVADMKSNNESHS